jgi:uncharacterized membrane protein
MQIIINTVLITLLPISELRGGLWYALSNNIPLIPAYLMCVSLNALVGPCGYFFLSTFHKILLKWKYYEKFFNWFSERALSKIEKKVEKYGYLGLTIFVAIPLPITGAYTGVLGAWILGMKPKKVFLCVLLGVIISGIIVSTAYYLVTVYGVEFLKIFIKEI